MDGVEDDDDFGELYADVELEASTAIGAVAAPEQAPPPSAAGPAISGTKESEDEDDCESEDDLNIVLNDEDCKAVPGNDGTGGGSADDETGVNGDGCDESKVSPGAALSKRLRTSGGMGVPSEDNWDDYNDYINCKAGGRARASPSVPQSGYSFTLPRSRTIFDVDIDALKEKPWRYPGADMTDFFNFGLDEESWKTYCNSLEQMRQQTSLCSRISVFRPSKTSKAFENGMDHVHSVQGDTASGIAQTSQCIVSHLKDFPQRGASRLIAEKGRAIEIEDNIVERQPSILLRRARSPDSDVIIQIPLQDHPEQFSCSGNSNVGCQQVYSPETSENGEVDAAKNAASLDCLEGRAEKWEELSSPERYSRIITVSKLNCTGHDKENISDLSDGCADPKGNSANLKVVNINEGVHGSSSVADPCLMENEESLLGRTKLTLSSSLFESDSELSDESISADREDDHIHLTSPPQSDSENLIVCRSKNSAGSCAEPVSGENYPRDRTLDREKYQSRKRRDSSTYKVVDGNVTSPNSGYRFLSDWGYRQNDCNRWTERQLFTNRYNKDLSSYYSRRRERDGETLADTIGDACKRFSYRKVDPIIRDDKDPHFSYRKVNPILRDDMDQHIRRDLNDSEIFGGRRNWTDEKDQERDCYPHRQRKYAEGRYFFPYRDTGHFTLQSSSYTSVENNSWSKINSVDIRLKSEKSQHGHSLGYEYDKDVMQDKLGTSFNFRDRDQGFSGRHYERGVSTRTEVNKSGKREGYKVWSRSVEDGSWDTNFEDDYPVSLDRHSFSYQPRRESDRVEKRWYDLMPSKDASFDRQSPRHRQHKRHCYRDERRDSRLFGAYSRVHDTRYTLFSKDHGQIERTRSNSKSKKQQSGEGESFSRRHDDELRVKEASVLDRRNSRRGTAHSKSFTTGEIFDHNVPAKPDLHNMIIEESGSFHVNRGFHVIEKVKNDQAIPCSRVAVGLSVTERKSSRSGRGRKDSSRVAPERKDLRVAKRKKTTKWDSVKTEIHRDDDGKWIDKFPLTEGKGFSQEIEGHIVAEEPISSDHELAGEKMAGSKKTAKNSEGCDEFDDSRLRESLARMEKRRERFKEVVTGSKETEKKTDKKADTKTQTGDTNSTRPPRKRRWGGL